MWLLFASLSNTMQIEIMFLMKLHLHKIKNITQMILSKGRFNHKTTLGICRFRYRLRTAE